MEEGKVIVLMCDDVPGCWVDIWRSDAFPDIGKPQASEYTTNRNYRQQRD